MKHTIIVSLVVMMLFLGGCNSLAPKKAAPVADEPAAAPAPQPSSYRWVGTQFEDVPIPPDFNMDYDASYLNVAGGGPRVADLRYRGQMPLTESLTYMQQGMEQAGWTMTSLTGVAIKTLRYVKNGEECVILLHKGDDGSSILMVRIHPY